jgi:hypothetical protein
MLGPVGSLKDVCGLKAVRSVIANGLHQGAAHALRASSRDASCGRAGRACAAACAPCAPIGIRRMRSAQSRPEHHPSSHHHLPPTHPMSRAQHFSAPAGLPVYALTFLSEDVLAYAGGGGAGRSGVANAIVRRPAAHSQTPADTRCRSALCAWTAARKRSSSCTSSRSAATRTRPCVSRPSQR